MKYQYDTFDTPAGEFSIGVDENGAVIGAVFGGAADLKKRLGKSEGRQDPAAVKVAREQVLAYFQGKRRDFKLKLAPEGTEFQRRVWEALVEIPYGETRSYGELAAQLGKPTASRAVGGANGANPICVIVPCHRVIGADGSLTGFAFGEATKRRLLEHEGALQDAAQEPLAL
jgi:methylated-DNA-[protein]-cysteine S-methyltransferase